VPKGAPGAVPNVPTGSAPAEPLVIRHARVRKSVAWAEAHPVWTCFIVALAARVVVAVAVSIIVSGPLFGDETTYRDMAYQVISGQQDIWDPLTQRIWRTTLVFSLPLSWLMEVWESALLPGRLLAATYGALTAAAMARFSREVVRGRTALVCGLLIALLPSQVLFSSLILKDAAVWGILILLAWAVSCAASATGRRLLLMGAIVASLVFLMGHARIHTTIVVAWAVVGVALILPNRKARLTGAVLIALFVPWLTGFGIGGMDIVANHGSLENRRRWNAVGADSAFVDVGRTTLVPLTGATTTTLSRTGGSRDDPSTRSDDRPVLSQAPGSPTTTVPSVVHVVAGDEVGGVSANVRYLPRGLKAVLLEPLPWRMDVSVRMRLAQVETILWYPTLALGLLGAGLVWRRRQTMAFPVLAGGGVLFVYALTEGNIGTAYRHRAEFTWVVLIAAGLAVEWLLDRRAQRRADLSEA
jgi:hypothetical protein